VAWNVELEDQLAGLERRHVSVVLGRKAVELLDGKLAPVRPHRRAQGDQCGCDVRGVRGGAEVVPEDRVLAVLSPARVADVASVEAAGELESPVPAACRLEKVPADRAHVPELRARGEPAGLAECLRHLGIDLEVAEGRSGADPRPVDAARNDPPHVDERLSFDQPVPQKRNNLRPPTK
jgi:hypothetical protein